MTDRERAAAIVYEIDFNTIANLEWNDRVLERRRIVEVIIKALEVARHEGAVVMRKRCAEVTEAEMGKRRGNDPHGAGVEREIRFTIRRLPLD